MAAVESGLRPGATFGPYVIADRLGAGGMGVVYRAKDTKLDRDVAIKVLPDSAAFDGERRSRLQREARLLASLSHPHIAAIHGLEEANGHLALVLELVDGPTLAERLERGPLPVPEAIAVAAQIAGALDAAHESGVIHRDLKPANIKLAPGRGVKVLDFGLAKTAASGGADLSQLPTVTSEGTRDGTILGTVGYMSPEQARGHAVDKRTDIWAFGCVVYDMLTARRAFPGATLSDTIVSILEREPDWTALPAATPPGLRRLLRRCLEKDAHKRLRDMGDAVAELTDAPADRLTPAATDRVSFAPASIAVAVVGLTVASAVVTWLATRTAQPAGSAPGAVVRFSIPPPPGNRFGSLLPDVETTYLALSRDSSQLAFIATDAKNVSRVWLRPLSSLESRPVAGTEGATFVFWSPDGRALGFVANDQLKRLDLPDGRPVALASVPAGIGVSATWTDAGHILFASLQSKDILRITAGGGDPAPAASADAGREVRLFWPEALPGDGLIYLASRADGTGELKLVTPGEAPRGVKTLNSNAAWVDPGFIVYASEGSLLAQAADPATGRLIGQPHAVADRIDYSYVPARAVFSASRGGGVVFQSHSDTSRLVRFNRTGTEIGAAGGQPSYTQLRIAPDGRRILLTAPDSRFGTNELWIFDPARGGVETRVTSDPMPELPGPWLPGQSAVIFSSARGGAPHLFHRDLSTGVDRELHKAGPFQIGGDFTPDGRQLVFSQRSQGGNWSLMTTTLEPNAAVTPLHQSAFSQEGPRLSRDGRAIAFVSNESGRSEIYVAAFPMSGQNIRASTEGARGPRWSPDGRELFYVTTDGRLMSVPISTTPTLEVGTPRLLFNIPRRWYDYDISSADGTIVAIVPQLVAREQPLTVVLNWKEEIRK